MNKEDILNRFVNYNPEDFEEPEDYINCLILTEDRDKALLILEDLIKSYKYYHANIDECIMRIELIPEDNIPILTYKWYDLNNEHIKGMMGQRFNCIMVDKDISKEWLNIASKWFLHCPQKNVKII